MGMGRRRRGWALSSTHWVPPSSEEIMFEWRGIGILREQGGYPLWEVGLGSEEREKGERPWRVSRDQGEVGSARQGRRGKPAELRQGKQWRAGQDRARAAVAASAAASAPAAAPATAAFSGIGSTLECSVERVRGKACKLCSSLATSMQVGQGGETATMWWPTPGAGQAGCD